MKYTGNKGMYKLHGRYQGRSSAWKSTYFGQAFSWSFWEGIFTSGIMLGKINVLVVGFGLGA
jgi:hypothetical protein